MNLRHSFAATAMALVLTAPAFAQDTTVIGVSIGGRVHAMCQRFAGDRDSVRVRAAQAALALVYHRLREEPRG